MGKIFIRDIKIKETENKIFHNKMGCANFYLCILRRVIQASKNIRVSIKYLNKNYHLAILTILVVLVLKQKKMITYKKMKTGSEAASYLNI